MSYILKIKRQIVIKDVRQVIPIRIVLTISRTVARALPGRRRAFWAWTSEGFATHGRCSGAEKRAPPEYLMNGAVGAVYGPRLQKTRSLERRHFYRQIGFEQHGLTAGTTVHFDGIA